MGSREELTALRRLAELEAKSGQKDYAPVPGTRRPELAPDIAPRSATLLPFSADERGTTSFDPSVGIVGAVKRAVTAPGEVYTGQLDPRSEEGAARTLETAAVLSPMGAASRVQGSVFAPRSAYQTVTPKAPTRKALATATTEGYDKVGALDVKYNAAAVEKMAADLENSLNEQGFIAGIKGVGDVHKLIQELKGAPEGSYIKMSSLDAVRQRLGEIAGSPKRQVSSAASRAIEAVDEFIATPNPAHLVDRAAPTGPGITAPGHQFTAADVEANRRMAVEAAEVIQDARGNAAAGFRSDSVTGLEQTVARRAAAANSGRNIDNTIRQRLTSFIESRKGSRGLNQQEKDAIDDVIFGRPSKNAARYFGNLLGGGGGLGSAALSAILGVGGASTMGPMGAALAVVPQTLGAGSRMIANQMSKNEMKALDELIRSRSPLAAEMGGPRQIYAPGYASDTAMKAALGRQLGPENRQPQGRLEQDLLQRFLAAGGA